MPRRTKIVATLGPATDSKEVLDDMIQAGMDVVRVNFSHGTPDDHIQRAGEVRNRARAHGHQVGRHVHRGDPTDLPVDLLHGRGTADHIFKSRFFRIFLQQQIQAVLGAAVQGRIHQQAQFFVGDGQLAVLV